jgi:hypothetical protein
MKNKNKYNINTKKQTEAPKLPEIWKSAEGGSKFIGTVSTAELHGHEFLNTVQ